MKVKVGDSVKIVQDDYDRVQPRLVGLEGRVTVVYPRSQHTAVHIEITFADGTKRVFYEDEIEKLPAA